MAQVIHRQLHYIHAGWLHRTSTQSISHSLNAAYGWPCFHRSHACTWGGKRHNAIRAKAQENSDQAASSTSVPGKAATATKVNAGSTEGDPSSAAKGASSSNPSNPDPSSETSFADLATDTSFIEKLAGAVAMYGLTVLLSSLAGVDATQGLQWYGGAPLAIGCATAAPVILAVGLLFLPSLDPGFTVPELRTISEVDEAEEAASFDISISTSSPSSPSSAVITAVPTGRGGVLGEGDSFSLQAPFPDSSEELEGPPLTLASLQRGLWLYQVQVLKPWFPEIRWSSVGLLFLASCAAAGSQELLVRGYGGSLLVGWYGHLLASATDVNNPIYWAKVFRLVTPDTARWMAAFSLLALQVALSSLSVQRASRFARTALNRVGRVDSKLAEEMGTVRGLVRVTALQLDDDDAPTVKGERDLLLEFPTAEERVTYWASLGVSVLLCGAMNYAWAASGSLLGSYTARVAIDGVVTVLQQLKEKQLPDRARWNEVRRQLQEEEEDEDKEEKRREEEKGVAAGTK